jgi:S-adenosylmethionine uptake transporter
MKHLPDNTRGAILMMLAMAAFAINDAMLKDLVTRIDMYQVLALRSLITIGLVLTILPRFTGPASFRMPKRDAALIALRSASEVGASIGIVSALAMMPFANVSALLQSTPLLITLAAALVFGAPIGWRRLCAILIGFGGVLLIARPGSNGFADGVLFALLGVVSVTVRDLTVRGMSVNVPTTTVTLGATVATAVVMSALALGTVWEPPTMWDWVLLALNACVISVAFVLSIVVMQTGEISFTAPYRYTALIWAIVIGFLAFGEWPEIWTLIGAAIIAATGIYTLIRERQTRA